MRKLFMSFMALIVAGALFAGCSQSKPAAQPPKEEPKKEEPAPVAQSFVAKSADGKLEVSLKVTGKVAMVEMMAKNFVWNKTFAAKEPKDPKNVAGEGHAILTLTGKDPMYVGTVRHSLSGLEPGKYSLKVQLVNNDNSATGTEATVEFEVK